MIDRGYILVSRKIDDSEVSKMPPCTRELWSYFLRKVNHKTHKSLLRGQGHFLFADIQKDLSWSIGYRAETYSKPQITKAIRRLKEAGMIETAKATRGIVITVSKYDYYQNPANYEGNDEGNETGLRRKREGIHDIQECKNDIQEIKNNTTDFEEFWNRYHQITGIPKKDKAAAEKYHKKLSATDRQKAIDNITQYFDSLSDKKYCRMARTYLENKNFNDEFRSHQPGVNGSEVISFKPEIVF